MPVFLPQEPEYALHTQALLCWYVFLLPSNIKLYITEVLPPVMKKLYLSLVKILYLLHDYPNHDVYALIPKTDLTLS
jgi:hypothetical protein